MAGGQTSPQQSTTTGVNRVRPTAAPRCFPFPDHQTVAEADLACVGVHPAQILNSLAEEAARWPLDTRASFRAARLSEMLALKSKGWKQSAIAARLGISDSLVSRLIRQSPQHSANKLTDSDCFSTIQRRTAR